MDYLHQLRATACELIVLCNQIQRNEVPSFEGAKRQIILCGLHVVNLALDLEDEHGRSGKASEGGTMGQPERVHIGNSAGLAGPHQKTERSQADQEAAG